MAESSFTDSWFVAAKAGRSDDLKNLLGSIPQKDLADHLGNTALHYAASAGHAEAVDVLLGAKVNVNIKNSSGDTPLHKAAWRNSLVVVKKLVAAGGDLFAVNNDKQRPIDLSKNPDIIAELSPPIPVSFSLFPAFHFFMFITLEMNGLVSLASIFDYRQDVEDEEEEKESDEEGDDD